MKTTLAVLTGLICAAASSPAFAVPLLLTGETFTYEFSTLPFNGSGIVGIDISRTTIPPFTQADLWWNAVPLDAGAQIEVKIFENSPTETPLFQQTVSARLTTILVPPSPDIVFARDISGRFILQALHDPKFTDVWKDLQGAFSITVLSGSVYISDFLVGASIPTGVFDANGFFPSDFYRGQIVLGPGIVVLAPEASPVPEHGPGVLVAGVLMMFLCWMKHKSADSVSS